MRRYVTQPGVPDGIAGLWALRTRGAYPEREIIAS